MPLLPAAVRASAASAPQQFSATMVEVSATMVEAFKDRLKND